MSRLLRSGNAPALWLSLALAMLIAGCWASKFTLVSPDKARVDRKFVGDWNAVNPGGDQALLVIRNIDDHLYYIETRDQKDPAQVSRYVGMMADVNGATFAHLRPLSDDGSIPEDWLLMRVALGEDGKLTIDQLDEQFMNQHQIESAEQLRLILEQNLNKEAMYDKDERITATRVVK
jgi:hypothetical protein